MGRRELIEALRAEGVSFVIVGGFALVLRGSSRTADDLDICYELSKENLERLARAITPFNPRLRGAPPRQPALWDDWEQPHQGAVLLRALRSAHALPTGMNFTLTTAAGDLDLLGEISGLGTYEGVAKHASELELYEAPCLVLDLDGLELTKRAAGREKDLLDLAEIELIRRRPA